MQGRRGPLISSSQHITLRNIRFDCKTFFDVDPGKADELSDFHFENLNVTAEKSKLDRSKVTGFILRNVIVNGTLVN
jgi:hypothetical protein